MSQQINLFNPIFLKQKKYFSAVAMAQALGLILLGAALLSVYSHYQFSGIRTEAGKTKVQLSLVQAQLNKINVEYAPPQKNQDLEDGVRQAETEIKSLQQVFDILQKGDIGNNKGYSAYLRAFSQQILDGLWLTGFDIVGAGTEMGLQGRALRPELVPAYINRLKQEPATQGKTFSTLEIQLPQVETIHGELPADTLFKATPYIEFALRSSGMTKETPATALPKTIRKQAEPSGVQQP